MAVSRDLGEDLGSPYGGVKPKSSAQAGFVTPT